MKRVLILGAGDHGQVVADILLAAARAGAEEAPVGFLDDDERLVGNTLLDLPVLGTISERYKFQHDAVIVAIGSNAARQRISLALCEQGVVLANALHPTACIAPTARLGRGVMVSPGAVIETGAVLGDGVIINTNSVIGHHSRVEDYAHISGCAIVGGHAHIGQGAMVGLGGAVLPGARIGPWSLVAMGSAATKDIPAHCIAMGVPARIIQWDHAPGDLQTAHTGSPSPAGCSAEPALSTVKG